MPTRRATAEEIEAAEKLVDELSTKARDAAPSKDDLPLFLLDEEWQARANAAVDAFEAAALAHEKLLHPDEPERWLSDLYTLAAG